MSNWSFNELHIGQTLNLRFSVWQRKGSNYKYTSHSKATRGCSKSTAGRQPPGAGRRDVPTPISHQITAHSTGQVCPIFPSTSGSEHAGNMLILSFCHCINPAQVELGHWHSQHKLLPLSDKCTWLRVQWVKGWVHTTFPLCRTQLAHYPALHKKAAVCLFYLKFFNQPPICRGVLTDVLSALILSHTHLNYSTTFPNTNGNFQL